MRGSRSGIGRRVVIVVGMTAAVAASSLVSAPAAGARPDDPPRPFPGHTCPQGVSWADGEDGPITDLVHHNVEPLFPAGAAITVHEANCHVWNLGGWYDLGFRL